MGAQILNNTFLLANCCMGWHGPHAERKSNRERDIEENGMGEGGVGVGGVDGGIGLLSN